MDKINAYTPQIATGLPLEKKLEAKAVDTDVNKTAQEARTPLETIAQEPVDQVEFTRQDRIKLFLDKCALNIADYIELGSSAFIGEIVGSAVAFSLIGGIAPVAIGGGIGALLGMGAHHFGFDKKIASGINKAIGYSLLPFVYAGKAIKKAVSTAIDAVRPSKKKEETQASIKADGQGGTTKKDAPTGALEEGGAIAEKGSIAITKTVGSIDGNALALKKGDFTEIHADGGLIADQGGSKTVQKEDEKAKKKGILGAILKGFSVTAAGIRSIPKFIYPSIRNATATEKAFVTEVLDSLPLKDVTSTSTITINPTLAEDMSASGLARPLLFDNPLDLDKGYAAVPIFNREVLVHELGHARDFTELPIPGVGKSFFRPFGKEPYVFDPSIDVPGEPPYAAKNHFEDFAQSHQFYHNYPDKLKAIAPEKYAALEKLEKPGLYELIMDRPSIRELGKKIANAIDKVPHLRTALNALGTILGPAEMNVGAHTLEEGIKEGDLQKKYQGKMQLAQGIAISRKTTAPIGLGIAVARIAIDRKLEKGKWSIEKANNFSDAALATSLGPCGLAVLAGVREMLKTDDSSSAKNFTYQKTTPTDSAGNKASFSTLTPLNAKSMDKVKQKKDGEETSKIEGQPKPASLNKAPIPVTEEMAKSYKIKGIAAGGLAGGAVGYILGSVLWGAIGSVALGPLGAIAGGIIGKIAGSAVAFLKDNVEGTGGSEQPDPTALTKDDKKFILKVSLGAVTGGTLGALVGTMGGTLAGSAIGGMVGGPVGALIGGVQGKTVGAMLSSYYGAKVGAKVGRMFHKDEAQETQKLPIDQAKFKNLVVFKDDGKKIERIPKLEDSKDK